MCKFTCMEFVETLQGVVGMTLGLFKYILLQKEDMGQFFWIGRRRGVIACGLGSPKGVTWHSCFLICSDEDNSLGHLLVANNRVTEDLLWYKIQCSFMDPQCWMHSQASWPTASGNYSSSFNSGMFCRDPSITAFVFFLSTWLVFPVVICSWTNMAIMQLPLCY